MSHLQNTLEQLIYSINSTDLSLDVLPKTSEVIDNLSIPYGKDIIKDYLLYLKYNVSNAYWNSDNNPFYTPTISLQYKGIVADLIGDGY